MQRPDDKRTETRSNVFLTAVLGTSSSRIPVRIRNISSNGALVDGPALPAVGTSVRLVRGSLVARGTLAWQQAGHAGLNFERAIDTEKWVQRTDHAGQERVDGIVDAIRRSEPVADRSEEPDGNSLDGLSEALDELCSRLASSDIFPPELGEELLKLDVIAQSLRDLRSRISS